jgi:hypothetical protein
LEEMGTGIPSGPRADSGTTFRTTIKCLR